MYQHRGPILTASGGEPFRFRLDCGNAQLYDPWKLAQKVDEAKLADLGVSNA
jgi:hypothetical protein